MKRMPPDFFTRHMAPSGPFSLDAPVLGSFIRPVGSFGYCFEMIRVNPSDGHDDEQWVLKRWGMNKEKQPFNDGHSSYAYLRGLKRIAPDVWKHEWKFSTPRWRCCPVYYRRIYVGGQLELF
jgi:hypothetical protein